MSPGAGGDGTFQSPWRMLVLEKAHSVTREEGRKGGIPACAGRDGDFVCTASLVLVVAPPTPLLKVPLESCRFCGSSCVLVTQWVFSGCPSNRQSLV